MSNLTPIGYLPLVEYSFELPKSVEKKLRSILCSRPEVHQPTKLFNGVWYLHGAVYKHFDSHDSDPITLGWILLDDTKSMLWTNELDVYSVLPKVEFLRKLGPGSIYGIDSSKPHATRAENPHGLFCFLAFDYPKDEVPSMRRFIVDAAMHLHEMLKIY